MGRRESGGLRALDKLVNSCKLVAVDVAFAVAVDVAVDVDVEGVLCSACAEPGTR